MDVGHYHKQALLLIKHQRHIEALAILNSKQASVGALDNEELLTRGNVLLRLGHVTEARRDFQAVLEARPDDWRPHFNIAAAFVSQGRAKDADAHYRRALEINPANGKILSSYCLSLLYRSDVDAASLGAFFAQLGSAGVASAAAPLRDPDPDRRLRLGFLSPDFLGHPVAGFFLPLLRALDADRFESFCYADNPSDDAMTEALRQACPNWRAVRGLPDAEVLKRIRLDGVDVLIDLAGRTAGNRLSLLAMRPAPLNLSFLGQPGPVALSALDGRFSEALVDPVGEDVPGLEAVWRLPWGIHCFEPPPSAPAVSLPPSSTPEAGGAVTFGSFCNPAKMTEACRELWRRVLLAAPEAKLLLKGRVFADPAVREDFARSFGEVAPRLDLRPWTDDAASHLAQYAEIDVALDSVPYNGTMTTCEALWMGVPTVALAGDRPAARVSASLLRGFGLSEFVARDPDGYVALASSLARDPSRLAALRTGLRERMARSPLMDPARVAGGLMEALRLLWRRRLERDRPRRVLDSASPPPREGRLCLETAGGVRMRVSLNLNRLTCYVLLEQEDWFEAEAAFLRRLVRPGDNVLDVGANHGAYALPLAKAILPDGKLFAFEPGPEAADALEEGGRENGLDNLILNRVALTDRTGTVRFHVSENSEMSAVAAADQSGEVAPCLSLDDWAAGTDLGSVELVKLDAEGQEDNIIRGGERFFRERSPLVMLEIKHCDRKRPEAARRMTDLGYDLYRLLPGLALLLPDAILPEDPFTLNVFACKPDLAASLEGRGLLARRLDPPAGPPASDLWRNNVDDAPYARVLAPAWNPPWAPLPDGPQYLAALGWRAMAFDLATPPDRRAGCLAAAYQVLAGLNRENPNPPRLASLARIAWELGLRQTAVTVLEHLLKSMNQSGASPLAEPFLPPSPRFDALAPGAAVSPWLRCAALEQYERLRHYSSFYTASSSLPLLEEMDRTGFLGPEMERRRQLVHLRRGSRPPALSAPLDRPAPDNRNPVFWASLPSVPASSESSSPASTAAPAFLDPEEAKVELAALGALFRAGRFEDMAARAGELTSRFPQAGLGWKALGAALMRLRRPTEAEPVLIRAVELLPEDPEPLIYLAGVLRGLGRLEEAAERCQEALKLAPHNVGALNNLGNILRDMGRLTEAETWYRQALARDPDCHEALSNLGYVLRVFGRFAESNECYARALELDPSNLQYRFALLHGLRFFCAWERVEELWRGVPEPGPSGPLAADPFAYLCEKTTAAGQLVCARTFAENVLGPAAAMGRNATFPDRDRQGRRLRIGYLSADFRQHPVGALIAGLPAAHDRDRFEVLAYSYGPDDGGELRSRFVREFDLFRDVRNLSPLEAARRIREDEVDVLVDLTGYTGDCRPAIVALRPAPIQVNYLGYPGTMGAQFMDYVIVDRFIVPEGQEAFFAEQCVFLPHCYQINDRRTVNPAPSRRECGLPEDAFVFCSFNAHYKITSEMFGVWMRLLAKAPDAVLWLLVDNETARKNLRQEAEAAGIDPERLYFADRKPPGEHLARHAVADLFLDTFPYNAHTTASDCLWAGLPLVTLAGETFNSRVAGSILTTMGLAELVAHDLEAYFATALELTRNRKRLADLRRRVEANRFSSPLFDAARTVRALERAYLAMWERRTRGAPPGRIEAPDDAAARLLEPFRAGDYVGTVREAEKRLLETPDDAAAWSLLGVARRKLGNSEAALPALRRAAELCPDGPNLYNLGNALRDLGRLEEAAENYRLAAAAARDFAPARNNLGHVLRSLGRLAQAEACCLEALELQPDYVEALLNLGHIRQDQGRLEEAAESYGRAAKLRPELAEPRVNLGSVLTAQGRFAEAVAWLERAISINPNMAGARNNLGNALNGLGRTAEAVDCFRKAAACAPGNMEIRSNLLLFQNYLPDMPVEDRLETAREFGRLAASRARPFVSWGGAPDPRRRLRIGMVSGDFREHPVGRFLRDVLPAFDPEAVELLAYPTRPGGDALTGLLRPRFSAWRPTFGLNDAQMAEMIHEDAVDVLLDLSGHTLGSRLGAFAWKPAPIQVSWLGYVATTGLEAMDYLLGDPQATPAGDAACYVEKLWRLPRCYMPFSPPEEDVAVETLPALRNGFVTFGSFNNLVKVSDRTLAVWARLLADSPDSRLLVKGLRASSPAVNARLAAPFEAAGVSRDRLVFEDAAPRRDFLAAHNRVDLALDPFPYPGGLTTMEALWMGTPVLALDGRGLVNHMRSILTAVGLTDWIAADPGEYVRKGAGFAADLPALAELRLGLRRRVLQSPLCDAPAFCRDLEAAFREMWKRHLDRA